MLRQKDLGEMTIQNARNYLAGVGKFLSLTVLARSEFLIRCCPLADSRGNMLFYSLHSASYLQSFTSAREFINDKTFLSDRDAIYFSSGSMTQYCIPHGALQHRNKIPNLGQF